MKRAIISWSGGKDAAWSLHRIRGQYQIVALLTTVSETDQRVPIHQVPVHLVEAQAEALGLPLWKAALPQPCANEVFAERLRPVWQRAAAVDIDTIVFGDLFLADIRAWRENLIAATTLTPVFPLWLEPTSALAREMIAGGLRATVCAPDADRGKRFDHDFIESLPPGADPCGENGEFHTFVTHMPGFKKELSPCAESFR